MPIRHAPEAMLLVFNSKLLVLPFQCTEFGERYLVNGSGGYSMNWHSSRIAKFKALELF